MNKLREDFECTYFFKNISDNISGVNYKSKGGYFVDDTPYFYLNGAFDIFCKQASSAPDGWILVPKEPTEEMINNVDPFSCVEEIYKAMIEAVVVKEIENV